MLLFPRVGQKRGPTLICNFRFSILSMLSIMAWECGRRARRRRAARSRSSGRDLRRPRPADVLTCLPRPQRFDQLGTATGTVAYKSSEWLNGLQKT